MKTCIKCQEAKPLTGFYKQSGTNRYHSYCKLCNAALAQARKKDPVMVAHDQTVRMRSYRRKREMDPIGLLSKHMVVGARRRAEKAGLAFDLDVEWAAEKLRKGMCEVTHLPFTFSFDQGPFVPSLDKRVPALGYTKANTQMVVFIYNTAKQDWTHEHIMTLAQALTIKERSSCERLVPLPDTIESFVC